MADFLIWSKFYTEGRTTEHRLIFVRFCSWDSNIANLLNSFTRDVHAYVLPTNMSECVLVTVTSIARHSTCLLSLAFAIYDFKILYFILRNIHRYIVVT